MPTKWLIEFNRKLELILRALEEDEALAHMEANGLLCRDQHTDACECMHCQNN